MAVSFDAPEEICRTVEDELILTIERYEQIFSAFEPTSELNQWIRGESPRHSPEFVEAMRLARYWQERSGSRFNPLVGRLSNLWIQATERGEPPDSAALARMAESIATPRFEIDEDRVTRLSDCDGFNLNALAKGFIVDRAATEVSQRFSLTDLVVNAGGDLRHVGLHTHLVAIANPRRAYDNEPPLCEVNATNRAVATSGQNRRGQRIGSQWFGHVIDPRTGWPVEGLASVSVIGSDGATADVWATILSCMDPVEAVALTESAADLGCLVVTDDGQMFSDAQWDALIVQR